jgi:hypothetical protein
VLRRHVRPGGLYLIDDAFVQKSDASGLMTREGAREAIAALGDSIVREVVPGRGEIERFNRRLYERLSRRARELGRERARLRPALREFLARQRHANALLAGRIRPAIWVVRRGRDTVPGTVNARGSRRGGVIRSGRR